MANSIESRQPFMDYRLITFLNSIPSNYKLHKGWTKYLARIAFKNKLPDNVVWRKDKLGWPEPSRNWISGSFGLEAWNAIKKSRFLEDFLDCKILDDVLPSIKNIPRPFFRLYNLARHYEIFFNRQNKFIG
jgi:asparagine synthase (glutamine-hydrolysing)